MRHIHCITPGRKQKYHVITISKEGHSYCMFCEVPTEKEWRKIRGLPVNKRIGFHHDKDGKFCAAQIDTRLLT